MGSPGICQKPWSVPYFQDDGLGTAPDALESATSEFSRKRTTCNAPQHVRVRHFDTGDDSTGETGVQVAGEGLGLR